MTKITAEIGTTGVEVALELTGVAATDLASAIRAEHPCDDTNGCDIARALDDGYPFWAAQLLQSATETPLLDAVIAHYVSDGLDFRTLADLDCNAWLETPTWTEQARQCDACNSITFGSEFWTPAACASCGASELSEVER